MRVLPPPLNSHIPLKPSCTQGTGGGGDPLLQMNPNCGWLCLRHHSHLYFSPSQVSQPGVALRCPAVPQALLGNMNKPFQMLICQRNISTLFQCASQSLGIKTTPPWKGGAVDHPPPPELLVSFPPGPAGPPVASRLQAKRSSTFKSKLTVLVVAVSHS